MNVSSHINSLKVQRGTKLYERNIRSVNYQLNNSFLYLYRVKQFLLLRSTFMLPLLDLYSGD